MELLEEIEEWILFLLTALLVAFTFYQTIGAGLGTETPIVSVVSDSMEPTFERGDIIVVRGASMDDIEVGDVIVFESKHEIINDNRPPLIHRVIEKSNGTVSTQGDANDQQLTYCLWDRGFHVGPDCHDGTELVHAEDNITSGQIEGKMMFIIPELAHLKFIPTCLFYRLRLPADHPAVQFTC